MTPGLGSGRSFGAAALSRSHPVIGWLLDSDPSIRWQVLQNLCDAPADVVSPERARVATQGWGRRTILVLEALTARGGFDEVMAQAREMLLRHRLYRSHRMGEVARSEFTRLSFPPRWHYDVLRALELTFRTSRT